MDSSLKKQQEAFKKVLSRQPQISTPVRIIPQSSSSQSSVDSAAASSLNVAGGRHINWYIHSIIMYLKSANRPVSLKDIEQELSIDFAQNPIFLERVSLNDRVTFDHDNRTLTYIPPFNVRNKNDIVPALMKQPHMAGIDFAEIKDAFPNVSEAIAELCAQKKVHVVSLKDNGKATIFLNQSTMDPKVDDEFKAMWSNVNVPEDIHELHAAMNRAGLKVSSDSESPATRPAASKDQTKKKSSKRPYRRIKITNDYLEGIDLNLDVEQ